MKLMPKILQSLVVSKDITLLRELVSFYFYIGQSLIHHPNTKKKKISVGTEGCGSGNEFIITNTLGYCCPYSSFGQCDYMTGCSGASTGLDVSGSGPW
jgi:hypothetical protein